MDLSFEGVLVGLVLLVPGFIASAIERVFRPRRFETDSEWVASSLLRSMGFNVVALVVVAWRVWDSDMALAGFWERLEQARLGPAVVYVAAVYALAAVWGATLGLWPQVGLRSLANRLGLSGVSRHDSVWFGVYEKELPEGHCAWLRVVRPGAREVFGALCHSSEKIDREKPIEVYLDPVYELVEGEWRRLTGGPGAAPASGLYLRVVPEQEVEFYFRQQNWYPGSPMGASDESGVRPGPARPSRSQAASSTSVR